MDKGTYFIVLAIILTGAMISAAIIYNNRSVQEKKPSPGGEISNGAIIEVSSDDDPIKGDSGAPVTIIEFSDFECPFCGSFYKNTLPLIEEKYIKTGKVKFVYRDFPLGFHPNAQKAAEAAECARDQEKFWEMHDMIFENQEAIKINNLKQYAISLRLDSQKFNDCLDSGKYADEVKKDFDDGAVSGVTGTPTFFINGEKLVGAHPFNVFEAIIEKK